MVKKELGLTDKGEKFSVEEVRRIITGIVLSDPQEAHSEEDGLWEAVLAAIANGTYIGEVAELAREALKTLDLHFPRWYA